MYFSATSAAVQLPDDVVSALGAGLKPLGSMFFAAAAVACFASQSRTPSPATVLKVKADAKALLLLRSGLIRMWKYGISGKQAL